MRQSRHSIRRRALWGTASIMALAAMQSAVPAAAQDDAAASGREVIVVTGTRRTSTVQDVPLNIAAITGAQIEEQGLTELADVSAWIPGIHVVDQGGRGSDRLVVRGLNADPLGPSEGIVNDGGGTVGTYVGEIPLFVDLKLNDMERVEVLLGPQGTLYGAGTLGGAVRYIPNRPQFDAPYFQVRGEGYGYEHGGAVSTDFGFTANLPIAETLALRLSLDRLADKGFIDYPFVVREIGVSDPDPDFGNPVEVADNLMRVEDANTEDTLSGRLALRWRPTSAIDANFTYYHQNKDVGGRQVSGKRSVNVPAGDYESAQRVREPNEATNELFALEIVADLGFAELTSATGYSTFKEVGQRDQTDLLITLEYSYEVFPEFTAYTREVEDDERVNQELRLVSTSDSRLQWIAGAFYNKLDFFGESQEFTPHFDEFAVAEFGGVQLRPDVIEYDSIGKGELTESAFFGELTYALNPNWDVTVGTRRYAYDLTTLSAFDLPLLRTVFFGDPPDSFIFDFVETGQSDDGWLFKVNTSYDVNDDILLYATISEGYRIGDANGVAACPDPIPNNQILCALPNEAQYFPDKTLNYEVGAHTQWMDGRFTLNGALYYIDWTDPQVSGATVNGAIPITKNGDGAESIGAEVYFDAVLTDALSLRGSYAYNNTELTATSVDLITFPSQGVLVNPTCDDSSYYGTCFEDGQAGDRLPGFPQNQASLFLSYDRQVMPGIDLLANIGASYRSDVETRTGGRGGGITLDGYTMTNAAVGFQGSSWTVALYADNLFDEYAETGVRSTPLTNRSEPLDLDGGLVSTRAHYTYIHPPRQIGVRFNYEFGG